MSGYRLRALRALSLDGGRLVRGAEFTADALGAYEFLRLGDARLADEADVERLLRELRGTTAPRPAGALLSR